MPLITNAPLSIVAAASPTSTAKNVHLGETTLQHSHRSGVEQAAAAQSCDKSTHRVDSANLPGGLSKLQLAGQKQRTLNAT